jgi:hypothetical protein
MTDKAGKRRYIGAPLPRLEDLPLLTGNKRVLARRLSLSKLSKYIARRSEARDQRGFQL